MNKEIKDNIVIGLGAYSLVFWFIALIFLNQENTENNYLILNIFNGLGITLFFIHILYFYHKIPFDVKNPKSYCNFSPCFSKHTS